MRYKGILDVLEEGYGFIRGHRPEDDIYVSNTWIKRYGLRVGDKIDCGAEKGNGKFKALKEVYEINGFTPEKIKYRRRFEELTPIFPNERIHLRSTKAMRLVDIIAPIGKGQRGIIVAPPKAGKTTLLKDIANSILTDKSKMSVIILLIDERPEEVTDITESLKQFSNRIEIVASTFDESPKNHIKKAEQVIEHAKRIVESGEDVTILMDSITRLARAYNSIMPSSGRTLSGGMDPVALSPAKKFFGTARNIREGGSLTIIATALISTGSRMDDVIYEEFKGTGNMELILDRNLQERRLFPAIDISKSSTRRDDLLLSYGEMKKAQAIRNSDNPIREILKFA